MTCRLVLQQLEEWHRQIAETTDLELAGAEEEFAPGSGTAAEIVG